MPAGTTFGPKTVWPWPQDYEGPRVAYVARDATGVRQQGRGGGRAAGRLAYVALSGNAAPEWPGPDEPSQPLRSRYRSGLSPLAAVGPLLRKQAGQVGRTAADGWLGRSAGGHGLADRMEGNFPLGDVVMRDCFHPAEKRTGLARRLHPPEETLAEDLGVSSDRLCEYPGGSMTPAPQPAQTLLVVDDNDVAREGAAAVLRQAGYQVVLAANGQEALDHLRAGPAPGLVLAVSPQKVSRRCTGAGRCRGICSAGPKGGLGPTPPTGRPHTNRCTATVPSRSAPHTPQTSQPSFTTLRWPQEGHRRKTTACGNRPGWGMPARSRAAATAGQDSGSGQNPVDWLVTSVTSGPVSVSRKNISPADRTERPPEQAMCSERRSATRKLPCSSTTKVTATKPSGFSLCPARRSHPSRSRADRTFTPAWASAAHLRMVSGPT